MWTGQFELEVGIKGVQSEDRAHDGVVEAIGDGAKGNDKNDQEIIRAGGRFTHLGGHA